LNFYKAEPALIRLFIKFNMQVLSRPEVKRLFFSLRRHLQSRTGVIVGQEFRHGNVPEGQCHHLASLDLAQEAKMAKTAEVTEKTKK
jgi:hypothetical protein